MFSTTYEIKECDLDARYAHVHHAHSIELLEYARLEYLKSIGYPLEDLLRRGLLLVIREIDVRYRRELFTGLVSITCEATAIEGRILKLSQKILNGEQEVAVKAEVHSVFVDAQAKRSIMPPDFFIKAWDIGGVSR